ncbi:MAG TPA: carbamoyl-phosphate synthase (glutamine-hydrolyzing) large subunit [Candidatus Copromorpha excrementipullorum]|uniref:Carbamoyl phosphate synthase large chain n=1 Tax=Candidatus Allocopromorpha excrementipullorum TaxID=2840743 RepID=A0A9D1N7T9_9FIRM|nr:carbamoyl-phosphate synthase (glutamine-hydrolyzing) large subunit [Candidatus Copromorpha excrementipullorum]
MPKKPYLKKILIIGSGPIVIGQAAEFDYAGTQACKAIREEGIETILVNSNPATIMTDKGIADKVYMEPLTEEALEQILEKERPDGMLAGFGGQTGLNLAMELERKGVLKKYGTALLGVNRESIKRAEDREEFKKLMQEIGEPIPSSVIATSMDECYEFVRKEGFPVIIRPAYTLGGTGGGIAENERELELLCIKGMENSAIGQILLEKSVAGWKEIEYEVIRDSRDNCIIICSMENLDPVGVHTGDSIVVAPTQTLRDAEYQMLRDASIKIIRNLEIEGGCNVQFALDPDTGNYIVIEVNPRVSRSSALASKAAGYPIAKIAAKIAIGYNLDELYNYVTQTTSACFEPTLDYVVVKFPKWPFDKFRTASRKLGTQMKATGEVMSIDRTFESALLKALTSIEIKCDGLHIPFVTGLDDERLVEKLKACDDERIFCIAEVMRRKLMDVEDLYSLTKIDRWFLNKIKGIIDLEERLQEGPLTKDMVYEAESRGFTDTDIITLSGVSRDVLQDIRVYNDIYPVYKMVDTCGGEFDALTPYYYSCYDEEDESIRSPEEKILVIGSGPIRIGQGIEFDYCCVQGVWAIKELGYEAIIMNNNPETVSTDFDTSDKLYFESLHIDNVMNVIKRERPYGVILQFGGQTSLNLAEQLNSRSINILGTSYRNIDLAEDREKFCELLDELKIAVPEGVAVTNQEEAFEAVRKLGYPLVVRPSYVIGGRAMQVVYNDVELKRYLKEAVSLSTEHPVLIDQYIQGKEIEVDAIADGEDILIPGIMEHVERAGVHSGDSISVYPNYSLSEEVENTLLDYTRRISKALEVVGLVNIQYAYDGKKIYVIEVNPRASRTVPILSKVTRVPMVKLAVAAMLGHKLKDSGYGTGLYRKTEEYAVKVPVFSSAKLTDMDIALGPEMKSTGEVLGIDKDLDKALYKGFLGAGMAIPTEGNVFVTLRESEQNNYTAEILEDYAEAGFKLYATDDTIDFMKAHDIDVELMDYDTAQKWIMNHESDSDEKLSLVINMPVVANRKENDSFPVRRKAIERGISVMTCMDTAKVFLKAIKLKQRNVRLEYNTLD